MVFFLYKYIFINIAYIAFRIYSNFNSKAKRRESIWRELIYKIPPKSKLRILVHSSSMGEFEQAKPVIERLKVVRPECEIIASFFSPSGYDNQKDYEFIDYAVYMPIDTYRNSVEFVEKINPDLAVFVRYDVWANVIENLKINNCKNYLICATKPTEHIFKEFFLLNEYYKFCLDRFEMIFTVGIEHTQYFSKFVSSSKIETFSDTRADRIMNLVLKSKENSIIPKQLIDDSSCLIAGSSWQKDEEIISNAINDLNKDNFIIRVIYTPHIPSESNINRIRNYHKQTILLSDLLNDLNTLDFAMLKEKLNQKHIIVDSIGRLLLLYGIGDFAFIGCGFGDGVHSVSEPAGYGIPIACGPNIEGMPDAVSLYKSGVLKIINESSELSDWLVEMINDKNLREITGKNCRDYLLGQAGSSAKIVDKILNYSLT